MKAYLRQQGPGILLVATTYFYFLIFAQFAFVELCQANCSESLKAMMAVMACCGISGSLSVPLLIRRLRWEHLLVAGILGCALSAFCAMKAQSLISFFVLSGLIGASLGIVTVSVTARLNQILFPVGWGSAIGIGTGLGYAFANFPMVFLADSSIQAAMAGIGILLAIPVVIMLKDRERQDFTVTASNSVKYDLRYLVIVFLALVWLDSAAFFIIQHTVELKSQSWGGGYLWRNAFVHLSAAVIVGFVLQRRGLPCVVYSSFGILAIASLFLNETHSDFAWVGGLLYPAGVSLYSAAFVAAPAYLARSYSSVWSSAILYSVAGWFGSANGIGMAETLHRVPREFLLVAGLLITLPWWWGFRKKKKILVVTSVTLSYFYLASALSSRGDVQGDSIQKGRQVYRSEGCIHCHSRYVRPESRDVEIWGPVVSLEEILKEQPVLIGNRRQGPDLLNVGNRRSRAWLRQHFIDPQSLVSSSSMPSYAHLFNAGESKGENLIDFLMDQGLKNYSERFDEIQGWFLKDLELSANQAKEGQRLFLEHCSTCHGYSGLGDGPMSRQWMRAPANLVQGPFPYTGQGDREQTLARIVKFGIPGTDMPGHETLEDAEVLGLVNYLIELRAQ